MFEKILQRIYNALFLTVEATSRDPQQTLIKRIGYSNVKGGGGGSARKNFETPSFDLATIDAAYDTEGYVRQAVDKYIDLIFKEGWQLKGKNEKALEYLRIRLAVMAEATDTPTNTILKEIADCVVKYANAFLVKARQKEALNIPGLNVQGMAGIQPIGGYFSLMPSTVEIARDKNGTVVAYQQKGAGSDKPLSFKPTDIVHIAWKKPVGGAFGNPFILSALDDIRLLREIEDNVANLLYKYLHPLYKFIVGLQEDGKESTPEEIEYVRQMIQEMPMDGTLVIPERYDVEVVGAEGAAIDASWALRYFEQRVFTVLGVPETVFGRASTANKSTADNLTVEMHDRVKAYQSFIADELNFRVIKELLMEGGFDSVVKPEDNVEFIFNEIAIDEMIKQRNQAIFEYEHNSISFIEMRHRMGMDPVVDEAQMFMNRVTIPVADATADAKAAAQVGTASTNNKQKPTNQHGTKTSPKKTAASAEIDLLKESFRSIKTKEYHNRLLETYRSLKGDVISAVKSENSDQIGLYMQIVRDKMNIEAIVYTDSSFSRGVEACRNDCRVSRMPGISTAILQTLHHRAEQNIERILNSLEKMISSAKNRGDIKEQLAFISSSFDVTEYRLNLMAEHHSRFSYNYGYALSALELGRKEIYAVANDETCEVCKKADGKPIRLYRGQGLMSVLPPWHHGCECYVKLRGD
jgi:hypothetical protein